MAASSRAPAATQVSPPPTLMRRAPAAATSATVRGGVMSTLTGLDTAEQMAADLGDLAQAGCEQHVGADPLEGQEPGDRVVEVGAAPDEVLGPGGEREGERQAAGGFRRGRHPLDRVVEGVDPLAVAVVLDRSADGPGLGHGGDRGRRRLGRGSVAVLEVDRERHDTAATTDRTCWVTSASVTRPSWRPSENAKPELVVATARKPSDSSRRAEPASHGLGMTNVPDSCRARTRRRAPSGQALIRRWSRCLPTGPSPATPEVTRTIRGSTPRRHRGSAPP